MRLPYIQSTFVFFSLDVSDERNKRSRCVTNARVPNETSKSFVIQKCFDDNFLLSWQQYTV